MGVGAARHSSSPGIQSFHSQGIDFTFRLVISTSWIPLSLAQYPTTRHFSGHRSEMRALLSRSEFQRAPSLGAQQGASSTNHPPSQACPEVLGPFPPGKDPPTAVCASHPYSKGQDCRFLQSPFCPSWPPPAPPQGCRTALLSPVLQTCTLVDLATAGPDRSGRSIFCTDGQSSGLKPSFHQPLPAIPAGSRASPRRSHLKSQRQGS